MVSYYNKGKRGSLVFGYIKIHKEELLIREYEAYKSIYCALCKQLGNDYSFFTRFILSYDCAFYAMLLMSLNGSCSGFEQKRCTFNPFKKCNYCKNTDDSLSKAAALSVITAYYKVIDNIEDSKVGKRILYKLAKPVFSHWHKKASKLYPYLDKTVSNMMSAQLEAEKNPDCHLDMAADPTAQMLAQALEAEGRDDSQKRILHQLGYSLGRWIYLIDAADDYNKDSKQGIFNPYNSYKENLEAVMQSNLSQALACAYEAYNLLEIVDFNGIIDNIILKGLPLTQANVLKERKENYERSI